MTTNNAVNVGLAGSTGSGNFVGATSPTLVTPTLGAATATSLTFSPTTSGIVGTTTNDNAAAGKVGELISSVVNTGGGGVSLTNTTPADITSISLTAGDWDVWGNVFVSASGINLTRALGWTSTTSATLPDVSLYNGLISSSTPFTDLGTSVPYHRYSLASTTTIYLSGRADFGAGTSTGYGGIYARRAR